MATATEKTTTTPARARASRAKAPVATKAAAAAPATAAVEEQDSDLQRVGPFELVAKDASKSYAKFDLAVDADGNATGCVGTVYAPLGTTVVKVVYYGPNAE